MKNLARWYTVENQGVEPWYSTVAYTSEELAFLIAWADFWWWKATRSWEEAMGEDL